MARISASCGSKYGGSGPVRRIAEPNAHWLTVNIREDYNLHASKRILFNHESTCRGETLVTRKITRAATRIKLGLQDALYMGSLAPVAIGAMPRSYVQMMWVMLQQEKPDDYVVATNETHTVREFIQETFGRLNLDWQKYVKYALPRSFNR